ncbi:hypothetical protein SH2C18_48020 [Clostridium sediminicola]|uniref:hypothetical protein n=1 Tax=Clostridium sediminicola TaxID=3114879 RepID=UPI0031F1DF94
MKIIILDYLFPKNHAPLYYKIINYLTNVGDVKVIARNGYYSKHKNDWKDVELEEIRVDMDGRNMIIRKLQSIVSMLKTRKVVAGNINSAKVVFTFDTIAFAIGRLFLKLDNFFILHHKNIDELKNPVKKFFFKTYMNKVNHIVFEDYFKEYLVQKIGVDEKRIHVIPHPTFKSVTSNEEDIYDCIGLSNSNDENFIKEIIDDERKNGRLKMAKQQVILRSKKYQFDNGYLKVITGYLSKKDYDNYIKKCKGVFIPLPSTFEYRVSGVIYDAISNYKVVIANNVPIIKSYEEKYPLLCIGVNNVEEFFAKVDELKYCITTKKDFDQFIKFHDKDIIIQKFKDAFKGGDINESEKK